MKKLLILLVLFLAIAGGHVNAQIASFSTTETLPFTKTTDVTAVCVFDDFFFAFGEGEALKVFFGSYRAEPLKYDTAATPRTVRDCQETVDGRIVIVGDNNLARVSSDNGKTWEDIFVATPRNYKLFVDGVDVWYFIPEKNSSTSYSLQGKNSLDMLDSGWLLRKLSDIKSGFCINGKSLFIATSSSGKKSSIFNMYKHSFNFYAVASWNLENENDSIISSLAKDGVVHNLAIDAVTSEGTYYKINTTEMISKESCDAVYPGDVFLSKGYVFPKGDSYFFGNDKDGQAIKVDPDRNRSELVCSLTKMTSISGKNNKVVIGGENGQVAISDYITEVDQNFDKEIYLIQSNGQLAINGSDDVKWQIFSSLGSLIISGEDTKIETSILSGVYIIKIMVGEKIITKKFVI